MVAVCSVVLELMAFFPFEQVTGTLDDMIDDWHRLASQEADVLFGKEANCNRGRGLQFRTKNKRTIWRWIEIHNTFFHVGSNPLSDRIFVGVAEGGAFPAPFFQ